MPRSSPSAVEQLLKCLRRRQFDQLGQFVEVVPALRPAVQLRLDQQGLPHSTSAIGFMVRQFCEQAIRALAEADPRSDQLDREGGAAAKPHP